MDLSQIVPYDIEAEQQVLGAMMNRKEVIPLVLEIVTAKSFMRVCHQTVFDAICELFRRSIEPHFLAVYDYCKENGLLTKELTGDYIATMSEECPAPSNAEYYAKIVRKNFIKRVAVKGAIEIINKVRDTSSDADEINNTVARMMADVVSQQSASVRHINDALSEVVGSIDKSGGVKTGYPDIDDVFSFFKSELTVIASRPSVGKTTIALNLIRNLSIEDRRAKCLMISLEQTGLALAKRIIASIAPMDSMKFRRGDIKSDDANLILSSIDSVRDKDVWYTDHIGLSATDVWFLARGAKLNSDVDMVLIDYLALLDPEPGTKNDRRHERIGESCKILKNMAKDLDIPVVCLAQLNREIEKRDSGKPRLSDLAESGDIERHADAIIFLYPDRDDDSILNVGIAKQRDGMTGVVKLLYRKQFMRIDSFQGY